MQVTKREKLIEAYEDAWFALLMDDVAEMEGAYWEERRKELENDPAAKVPESVDRRCIQTIDRCFAKRKRQKNLRAAGKVLNRIAVLVAVVSVLFTTALAVSEDVRVATANLLITVDDRYTEMHMESGLTEYQAYESSEGVSLDDEYFSKIHVGWLPDGFSYYNGTRDVIATFINEAEQFITVDCYSGSGSLQIDTENAESVENIEINGYQVMKVLKNGYTHLILANEGKNLFVVVFVSEGLSTDTAVKIMENISFL